jgi:hypothetical protein
VDGVRLPHGECYSVPVVLANTVHVRYYNTKADLFLCMIAMEKVRFAMHHFCSSRMSAERLGERDISVFPPLHLKLRAPIT